MRIVFDTSRYSEVNLVQVEKVAVKEDDSAVLLEGGGLQSASPKARTSSATSPIFRFSKLHSLDSTL